VLVGDDAVDHGHALRGDEYRACSGQNRNPCQQQRITYIRREWRYFEERELPQRVQRDLRAAYPGEQQRGGGDNRE
jgi:hypothetical protein